MLPGDAGGDNSDGGAMLDAGAEALFVGRSQDNEAGGGTVLGAGVEATFNLPSATFNLSRAMFILSRAMYTKEDKQ